jgi:cation:H+ antiporter
MVLTIALFALGIALLIKGAGWLVDGASRIAEIFRVSPLVVGLSVVAIGTSLPELSVSLTAALAGIGNVSVGNAIGSNICNIALVLGIAPLIKTLSVSKTLLRKDYPILVSTSAILLFFLSDGRLQRFEGILLLTGFIAYLVYLGKRAANDSSSSEPVEGRTWAPWIRRLPWLAILAGMTGIVIGARLTVDHGVQIARFIGVSEAVIGLTMIALGTSLPELVTSVVAMLRGESDMSLGNVIGSNIANIALVLGATSMIRPISVSSVLFRVDAWVMLGYTVVLFPLLRRRYKLTAKHGIFLLSTYIAYVAYLYLR